MAEWRSRGYVADSDDDEESQTSIHLVDGTSKTAHNTNNTEIADPPKLSGCKVHQNDEESGVLVCEVGIEGSTGEVLEKEKGNTFFSGGLDRLAEIQTESGQAEGNVGGKLSSQDYEDIDELQEGHYNDSPAAQLEAELLQGVHELMSPARPIALPNSWKLLPTSPSTSSPFPDVCQAPHEASHLTNEELSIQGDPTSTDDAQSRDIGLPPQVKLPKAAVMTTVGPSRASRTLRHRNPIQLHPYAIESEKYKQTLQARGVKPLRIAQMEAEAADARKGESQNMDNYAQDSQKVGRVSDHEDPGSSSPLRSQSTTTDPVGNANDMFVFGDDDELPDIKTFLQDPLHKYTRNGYKCRKIATASFRMPPGMSRALQRPIAGVSTNILNDDDDVMFDVPPSPPQSRSQTPLNVPPKLPPSRPIRKSAQAALPTPVTSSEPRRRQDRAISEDGSSDVPSHNRSRTVVISEASGTDESSSEEDSFDQLQRVQRKIRGVLPASWLKLDLKTRSKKPHEQKKPYQSLSPERTFIQRGVARTVTVAGDKSSDRVPAYNGAFILSDDEGSVSDGIGLQQRPGSGPQTKSRHNEDEGFFGDRWGEAGENDRIDAMLPSARQSRNQQKKEKKKEKRQLEIADVESHPRSLAHGHSKALQRHRPRQAMMTNGNHDYHAKKPEFRPPTLSILDAPSLEGTSIPHFLKVASRAARSRNDKGRHSPSRKYVRLATREDDQDASETLRNWREGKITPSAKYKSNIRPDRRPLIPRSANNALAPRASRPPKVVDDSREFISRSTLFRPHHPSTKRRKIQSSLDHLVQRQAREPAASEDVIRAPGEKPKKRGHLLSSIRMNSDSRPAMLETSREHRDELHAEAVFRRDLSWINRFDDESSLPNVLRLFEDDVRQSPEHACVRPKTSNANIRRAVARRSRKRRPHQMDVSSPWSRHSSAPIPVDDLPDTTVPQDVLEHSLRDVVTGLGPFGTRYTDTFDIGALPIGTCFHESTFIGSGSLARSLRLSSHSKLDGPRGYALFHVEKSYRWGPWNDTVYSELGELVTWVHEAAASHLAGGQESTSATPDELAVSALKSIIVYFSDHCSFLDPVDRLSCVQRCTTLMATFSLELDVGHISDAVGATKALKDLSVTRYIRLGTMKLVLANQIRQLSRHELVPLPLQGEVRSLVQRTAQQIIALATNEGLSEFKACTSNLKRRDGASYIIRNHQTSIEAFIVAQHVLRQDTNSPEDLWKTVAFKVPAKTGDGTFDIGLAEESWKQLFILLPFLELDANGILEIGQRFKLPFENWPLIKRLLNPVLEASVTNPQGQAPSFNAYCRALFGRCLHLIKGWGWRRCETIIGTLFDFFARNDLAHLKNEESHGSPSFLGQLDKSPSLAAHPEDRCLHILLKIIGSAIKHMRSLHSEKKIRDLVWRLMPNHGRSHPKEEAIRQADLDALRNHHDLLCTLYWASPSSCRPRPTVIRNLVHLESSHREACHINIRAWSNLVKYQLSTDEPVSSLQPFADWHEDILVQLLRQHSLARSEAEDQVRSIQYTGGLAISNELLESTIAKNQRQVEAILSDALVSLKLALSAARNEESAAILMSKTLAKVFDIFDTAKSQAVKTVIQALDVLQAFVSKSTTIQQPKPREKNDDSQDYGDWPASGEDEELVDSPKASNELPLQHLQEPLRHLLSNCFGSDRVPHDDLLLKIVDVWVAVAHVLVTNGARNWTDYLDRFGIESWSSLRDTEQTRKYNAYYLATLIEKAPRVWSDHRPFLLLSWIGTLVERESLLKFQHRLTESLLNAKCESPVLKNLPFWASASTGRFHISAVEFSERRLSLISSILSNMRVSLEEAVCDPSIKTAQLRQGYKDMLKHLMTTMKHNYQELGNGSNVAGAYVEFVHRVVEFLQQHTSNICPVDRFFTDNAVFPLPATDPTYVVAQLKNYALRLHDQKTPKQVAVFLQSVSERATVDGQQPNLVGQLQAAMSKVFEDGKSTRPTLRSFLVKAIIPAYIETACTAVGLPCGWILALPYLRALQGDFGELLLNLDGTDSNSVAAVASILTAFFGTVRRSLGALIWPTDLFQQVQILKLISACFSTITASLPALDYVVRLSGPTERAVKHIEFLKSFALYVSAQLQDGGNGHNLAQDDIEDQPYADTRSFATQELRDTLATNWTYDHHEKQYCFIKGGSRREVVIDIGLYEEEKAELFGVFRDFFECLGVMPALSDDDELDMMIRRNRVSALGALAL